MINEQLPESVERIIAVHEGSTLDPTSQGKYAHPDFPSPGTDAASRLARVAADPEVAAAVRRAEGLAARRADDQQREQAHAGRYLAEQAQRAVEQQQQREADAAAPPRDIADWAARNRW